VTVNGRIESYHVKKSCAKAKSKQLKKKVYPERHVILKKLYAKPKRKLRGNEGW